MNKMQKRLALVAISAGGLVAGSAHAALDAAVTTAITGAQTDMTALYVALTTAGAALFVLRLIYRKFTLR